MVCYTTVDNIYDVDNDLLQGVALKDSSEGQSSPLAEVWVVCMITYFVSKKKYIDLRLYMDSLAMTNGLAYLSRALKEKSQKNETKRHVN